MMGTTHALSASATFLAAAPILFPAAPASSLVAGSVIAAGWALMPDLDHEGATASRRLGPFGLLLSKLVHAVSGGHRKGTHTLLAVILVAAVAWWASITPSPLPLAVMAGLPALLAVPMLGRVLGWRTMRLASIALAALFGYLTYVGDLSPALVGGAVILGYQLHLIGDALTTGAIQPFYPFHGRRVGWPLFDTNSRWETGLRLVLLVATLVLAVLRLDPLVLA